MILNFFWDIYLESFFISLRAFLPSFSVLNTNQDKNEIIKTVSIIRDIKDVVILLVILLTFFL